MEPRGLDAGDASQSRHAEFIVSYVEPSEVPAFLAFQIRLAVHLVGQAKRSGIPSCAGVGGVPTKSALSACLPSLFALWPDFIDELVSKFAHGIVTQVLRKERSGGEFEM